MKSTKEKSLVAALSDLGLRDLPKKNDESRVWIRAVALVSKVDGSESYIYVVRDVNDTRRIIKDYGAMARIVDVKEIYPFSYLKPSYLPKFKTNKKEERIEYLTRFKKDADYSKLSVKELEREILNGAIALQYEQELREEASKLNEVQSVQYVSKDEETSNE